MDSASPTANLVLGIDIGTTSIAAVSVDAATGRALETRSVPNPGDLPGRPEGVHEQDPVAIAETVERLVAEFPPARLAWTGQMHGVVAVDRDLRPFTPFVTWRDRRCAPPRLGAGVMAAWRDAGLRGVHRCLPIPGYLIARRTGRCVIDETFLHSFGPVRELGVPGAWLPELDPGSMLGDNQAGVYAALHFHPGAAVVNLGTSGQLSMVGEGQGGERRPFPGGRVLRCRASQVGGRAFAELARETGLPFEELNRRAGEPRIAACIRAIVDDLVGDMDISGASGLVGVGNALRLNPALRAAVERRFGMPCIVPDVLEMAAYGAALFALSHP